jgi:tetratricopeptide (TPR) repeat protein
LELGLKYSIQILGWLTLVLILLVLPPAQSRAAWIAGIVACFYVLANHLKVRDYREKWRTRFFKVRKPIRVIILPVTITAILAGAYGLYIMKKGSADGRMHIWQVTSELIKEKPLLGHGAGSFDAKYMDAQAEWFASGKGTSAQGMVAGSPEAPFNELLKLWLEKGDIALLLAGGILYFIFFTNSKTSNFELQTGFKGALITLLTFSLFSYPFDISSFILQLVILIALLAGTSKTAFSISGRKVLFLTIPVALIFIVATIHFIPLRQTHYEAMKTWQGADQFYNYRAYSAAVAAYKEAYPSLQTNGLFLQMYGKALSMDEQYHKSNMILSEAKQYKSSQIIQNTLGDNHKALGNYAQAEEAYIKSAQMIPSTVFPKYLLAKLYSENGQHKKAKQIAETILNSEVKVESSATREIIREMKKILDTDE